MADNTTRRRALHPSNIFHYLPASVGNVLDIGCNEGAALRSVLELGVPKVFGIDINASAVAQARELLKGRPAEIVHGSADELPFASQSMDFVYSSETLEHVPAGLRSGVVREIHRVLRPRGSFVFSVPHAGLFAALDPSNVRFRLPALYEAVSKRAGGAGRDAGFEGEKHGVVWHHHFSMTELRKLLEPYFRITTQRFRGTVLLPVCEALAFPFYRRRLYGTAPLRLLHRLKQIDHEFDGGERLGYDVLVVTERCDLPNER